MSSERFSREFLRKQQLDLGGLFRVSDELVNAPSCLDVTVLTGRAAPALVALRLAPQCPKRHEGVLANPGE